MKTDFICLLLAGLLSAGCPRLDHAPSPPPPAVRVHTMKVASATVPLFADVAGTVRPRRRAVVSSEVMGVIESLPVALGQRVAAGETLARISAGEMAARLSRARAEANQVRRDLERERALLAANASTPQTVADLQDRSAMAEAGVREAEIESSHGLVKAPFDGVVAEKFAQAGDLAAPGRPLIALEEAGHFQIEADIPESVAAGLKPGLRLEVFVPTAGAAFFAPILELSSRADPGARTVEAKLAVPSGKALRSGEFARIKVPAGSAEALVAPVSSVTAAGEIERVFIAEQGRAVLRLVETGWKRGPDAVEILSGLSAGETVILDPPSGLREGSPVEAEP